MSGHRFLLSLVVGLSFSALASADSTNSTAAFLHSGIGASGVDNTRFTTNLGTDTTMSTLFAMNGTPASTAAYGNARLGGPPSGKVTYNWNVPAPDTTRIPAAAKLHTNFRLRTSKWNITEGGPGLSTPEPASLMLLSTGLIGIAAFMRRKLRAPK